MKRSKPSADHLIILGVLLLILFLIQSSADATPSLPYQDVEAETGQPVDPVVRTVLENDKLFSTKIFHMELAVGDVTGDGIDDLVVTGPDHLLLFQQDEFGTWVAGQYLDGPSLNSTNRPIIATIRNDGQNWLVYDDHQWGNSDEWLRSHRYSGTTLVENHDIRQRTDPPGFMVAQTADLNDDGLLELWIVEYYGTEGFYSHHLLRYEWNPEKGVFAGFELKDGGDDFALFLYPLVGDFDGDGTESLVWVSKKESLDIVRYRPGEPHMHQSSLMEELHEEIVSLDSAEYDGLQGDDVVVATTNGTHSKIHLISGSGDFFRTILIRDFPEEIIIVKFADLNGDGVPEIYVATNQGGIFKYDGDDGLILLDRQSEVEWMYGTVRQVVHHGRDELLITGPVHLNHFRVVSVTDPVSTVNLGGGDEGVAPDTVFTATMSLLDPESVQSGSLTLAFDATLLQVVDSIPAIPGTQILPGNCIAAEYVFANEVNQIDGTIAFAFKLPTSTLPLLDDCQLAQIQLIPQRAGRTTINEAGLAMFAPDGSELPTHFRHLNVAVWIEHFLPILRAPVFP